MRKIVQFLLCFVFCLSAGFMFTGCGADDSDVVEYYFVLDFGDKVTISKDSLDNIQVTVNSGNFRKNTITANSNTVMYSEIGTLDEHCLKFLKSVNALPKSTDRNFLGWYYAKRPDVQVGLDRDGDLNVDISTVISGDRILIFPKFSGEKTKYEK